MAEIDNHYGAYADLRAMGENRPALAEPPPLTGKALKAFEEGQALARLRSRALLRKSEQLAREKGWRR